MRRIRRTSEQIQGLLPRVELVQRYEHDLFALVGHHDARFRIGENLFDQTWQIALGVFQGDGLHGKLRAACANAFT